MVKNILLALLVVVAFISCSDDYEPDPIIDFEQITEIPDSCFEQSLIWSNVDSDGIINGQVATSDIKDLTELRLGLSCIKDLTGLQDFVSLKILHFSSNVNNQELTSFDAKLTPSLEVLTFESYSKLVNLKVSQAKNLIHLSVRYTKVSELDVSENEKLTVLNLHDNDINDIDLSNNLLLEELIISNNSFEQIDVSNNLLLKVLVCYNNFIARINVSKNRDLKHLAIGSGLTKGLISEIDVSQNPLLEILNVRHNKLKDLNIRNNPNLIQLECFDNEITSLDVSNNTMLTNLQCQDNKISSLDITTNSQLNIFGCSNNELARLSAKNENNLNLKSFDATGNPELDCIEADNPTMANNKNGTYEDWLTDSQVIFSNDCED